VIAYFDTSALVPLLVAEPSSPTCSELWNEATRVISSRLVYPEARAALAQAERMQRLTAPELRTAVEDLNSLVEEIDYLEVTASLALSAGQLAEAHALRGYDVVHLASANVANDAELVLVTGDQDLASAAAQIRISVALTTG
jgi:predicted nucleic acid-binding protein